MINFRSNILAGTVLVRSAIQSPDYAATISGWSINQSGSAEFNNAIFRGILDVLGTNGARIRIWQNANTGNAEIEMTPEQPAGQTYTYNPADIFTVGGTSIGTGDQALLQILSPSTHNSGIDSQAALINLIGQGRNSTLSPSECTILADSITMLCNQLTLNYPPKISNSYYDSGSIAQTFTGVAMQTVTGLDSIVIPAGRKFLYRMEVAYDATVAGKAKFAWSTSSANVTMDRCILAPASSMATNVDTNMEAIRRALTTQQAVGGAAGVANGFAIYHETGRIISTDAANQTITFQAAENVASTGMTVQSRSWFILEREIA